MFALFMGVVIIYLVPAVLLLNHFLFEKFRIRKKIMRCMLSLIPIVNFLYFIWIIDSAIRSATNRFDEIKYNLENRKERNKKKALHKKHPQLPIAEAFSGVYEFYLKRKVWSAIGKKQEDGRILSKFVLKNHKQPEIKKVLLQNEMLVSYLESLFKEHPNLFKDRDGELFLKAEKLIENFLLQAEEVVQEIKEKKQAEQNDFEEAVKERVKNDMDIILETTEMQMKRKL